ncbi:hypothetical protein PMAYCL1PPCAC_07442, partial [Pristionchus mayeri]
SSSTITSEPSSTTSSTSTSTTESSALSSGISLETSESQSHPILASRERLTVVGGDNLGCSVPVHECDHALALGHSRVPASVDLDPGGASLVVLGDFSCRRENIRYVALIRRGGNVLDEYSFLQFDFSITRGTGSSRLSSSHPSSISSSSTATTTTTSSATEASSSSTITSVSSSAISRTSPSIASVSAIAPVSGISSISSVV